MNVAILRGRLSSTPRPTQLASGDELVRYEVTVTRPGERADSVPVAWFVTSEPPALDAGDEVVVVGRVRRRFYGSPGGARSSTEVVADAVVAVTDRRRVRTAVARALRTVDAS